MFVDVLIVELVQPVVAGYFRRAATPQVRNWKAAAWAWLALSIALFFLVVRLEEPFFVGPATAAGLFCGMSTAASSTSASTLHRRW